MISTFVSEIALAPRSWRLSVGRRELESLPFCFLWCLRINPLQILVNCFPNQETNRALFALPNLFEPRVNRFV